MNIRIPMALVALLMAPVVMAEGIAGFWKHAEGPVWLEITLDDKIGKGVVLRNDAFPERVGREMLKDLRADDKQEGLWRGQIFAEKRGTYNESEITLPTADTMQVKVKVGFASRTVDWVRVDSVPAAGGN